jgi:hypothetical protein
MHNTMLSKIEDQLERLVVKRPYRRPELQIFGKVLHLTQGGSGNDRDGNLGGTKPD